jgi:hypothetical protein
MNNRFVLILILVAGHALAEEERCNELLRLDTFGEICGLEFIEEKTSARETRCKISYIDKSMGKKYVGEVGISSELIIKANRQINKKGENVAAVSFDSSQEGAKQRGIFIRDVSGLGENAYYTELDIHQTVTWFEEEYLYHFTVDKGMLNGEDWLSPCTPEQIFEIARAIANPPAITTQ